MVNENTPFASKKIIAPPSNSSLNIGRAQPRDSIHNILYVPPQFTNSGRIAGVLIGFFFPILSVPLLCLVQSKMKYGVCLGHVLNYTCAVVITLALAILLSVAMPLVCDNDNVLDSCMENVLNGTNVNEWIAYMAQCNDTSEDNIRFHFPLTAIMDTVRYEERRYRNMCPSLDFDEDIVGPQSEECAECVCFNMQTLCDLWNQYHYWLWVIFAATVICFLFSLGATHHYMHVVSQEGDKNYMMLKLQM